MGCASTRTNAEAQKFVSPSTSCIACRSCDARFPSASPEDEEGWGGASPAVIHATTPALAESYGSVSLRAIGWMGHAACSLWGLEWNAALGMWIGGYQRAA